MLDLVLHLKKLELNLPLWAIVMEQRQLYLGHDEWAIGLESEA